MLSRLSRLAAAFCGLLVLASCSSGKSSAKTYLVGGTLSGLPASSSIVLRNNGGDDLTVSANGAFAFATQLESGAAYAVTVQTAPAGQTCTVTSGTGTVADADVTTVAVACRPTTYSIGGTLSGLPASASIVLRDNGGDDLTVSADGPFTFATRLQTGAAYAVTVQTPPAGQTCTVTSGAGTVAAANVTSVAVACVPTTYSVGGTLAGLPASTSIVLRNNGGDDLTVTANGAFTFSTKLLTGAAYAVTVQTAPAGQTCTVTGGAGSVAAANVTSVVVNCGATTYSVGGTLSGLPASSSIVLRNNGGDSLTVSANGPFTFATRLPAAAAYAVTVQTAPAGQTCTVTGGTGTVAAVNVTSVAVACAPTTYSIGGVLAGLPASASLVLRNNGGDDLTVTANGPFTFATKLLGGAAYAVTVQTAPAGQSCTVTAGTGTVAAANVTSVAIACVPTYSVGGTLAGLPAASTIVLRNNGGDDLTVSANGPFTFATRLLAAAAYAVTVQTAPAGQSCTVTGGTGTIAAANVTSVAVTCVATYTVGGTLAGLPASSSVVLRNNGGDNLTLSANGTFTFATRLVNSAAYAVTVLTPPAGQACTVANGTGTVAAANVTSVVVTCSSTLSTIQSWTAPTTWGGVWADGATMLQHAHFDGTGIVSDKGPTFAMVGGAAPAPYAMTAFPGGTRYAGGPFPQEAVSYRAGNAAALDLPGQMLVCAVVRPARDRPFDSFESPIIAKGVGDGKYTVNHGGWVLMQMHESFCFHYEYLDGNGATHQFMSNIQTLFADQDFQLRMTPPQPLPEFLPDASYSVVCGGRSGDDIVVAVNAWDTSSVAVFNLNLTPDQTAASPYPSPYTLDTAALVPATIGGYEQTSTAYRTAAISPNPDAFLGDHVFNGYVLETAVWNEPATPENVRAKLNTFYGATASETYLRNRDAAYLDGSGRVHVAPRHAPRLDASGGYLFGLQSWNRVSYWIDGNADYTPEMTFPAGENLALWARTPASGAGAPLVELDPTVHPPIDAPLTPGQRITLPAGASLSIVLDQALPPLAGPVSPTPHLHNRRTWDQSGPVLGQVWLSPVSSGTLRIQKTSPQPGHGASCTVLGVAGTTCEAKDVALGGLTSGQWNRISLNGSFTADATLSGSVTANPGKLVLTNPGTSSMTFYAWGVQLTQLGGGGDPGAFDPGALMYDWNASGAPDGEPSADTFFPIDVLQLAPVTTSTAAAGFCIGAEATMPAGLPWSAPFVNARTAVAWVDSPASPTRTARVYVKGNDGTADAGKLCFELTGAAAPACAAIPATWSSVGGKHTVKGCMSAAGAMRLYGDDVQLATAVAGISRPDLLGGTLLVGNGDVRPVPGLTPWNGYVSRALVCRDTGNAADCR